MCRMSDQVSEYVVKLFINNPRLELGPGSDPWPKVTAHVCDRDKSTLYVGLSLLPINT